MQKHNVFGTSERSLSRKMIQERLCRNSRIAWTITLKGLQGDKSPLQLLRNLRKTMPLEWTPMRYSFEIQCRTRTSIARINFQTKRSSLRTSSTTEMRKLILSCERPQKRRFGIFIYLETTWSGLRWRQHLIQKFKYGDWLTCYCRRPSHDTSVKNAPRMWPMKYT